LKAALPIEQGQQRGGGCTASADLAGTLRQPIAIFQKACYTERTIRNIVRYVTDGLILENVNKSIDIRFGERRFSTQPLGNRVEN
jgi:hypothetical protein